MAKKDSEINENNSNQNKENQQNNNYNIKTVQRNNDQSSAKFDVGKNNMNYNMRRKNSEKNKNLRWVKIKKDNGIYLSQFLLSYYHFLL